MAEFKQNEIYFGFRLQKIEEINDIHSTAYLFSHEKSGARLLYLKNADHNKVFNVAFKTPPENDCGTPHILEHSVLCGSRKYEAKDPFNELAKGSLNTFLNAMTYADKTMYPVASCNEKDFQNLMDVYMDAVLHPNIYKHEEIFRQEGWNYHLEEADGELSYNGVVYNEMKGAFSSPDGVLDRMILNSLFPDTTYANESGGDPDVIPELTYEEYLNFHRTYYHPSNSYIYLYGNMDMEEKLNWLDQEYLSAYDRKEVDSEIHLQKPFDLFVQCIRSLIRCQRMREKRITPIFPTIRSLGLLWMKSCIWHSRSWIMHCFLRREHQLQKHFWKQESEKISAGRMTAAPISRSSPLWQRMPMKSRKQNL